ncbi:MAG: nitroreductase family protein [Bacteroidota bacterium]
MEKTNAQLKKEGRFFDQKNDELHPVSHWIRNRKSTYAYDFIDEEIPKSIVEEIVTNGLWAPTNKMTQPWRFEVLGGKHKVDLGPYMVAYYKRTLGEKQFPESRHESVRNYARYATLISIIFQRSKPERIVEWEEIAAISCAVQNMWLSSTAMGLGCYWDSAEATIKYCEENLTLTSNERSLGILFMGVCGDKTDSLNRKRKPLNKKLSWNLK